jgi:hypothetical protein
MQVVPELYNMADGSYFSGRHKRDAGGDAWRDAAHYRESWETQTLRMGDPAVLQYRVMPG